MPKVRRQAPSDVASPARPKRKPSRPRKARAPGPFNNRKADDFKFKDPALGVLLKELQGDAAMLERAPQAVDRLVTIFGTARAKPEPGQNGYADWVYAEALGEALREAGFSLSTGAGPGAMEAPMRGHSRRDAELDAAAGRSIGWEPGEPGLEGANIVLPHEQKANPYVAPDRLQTYNLFMFRMQFLFRDNVRPVVPVEGAVSPKLATPGGFGTIAEHFMYLAMRTQGTATEELMFLAHDDFFRELNAAFVPFLNDDAELKDLANVLAGDPKSVVKRLLELEPPDRVIDHSDTVPRMRDDLERGLVALDGKKSAVAFFSGEGPRSKAAAALMEQIAEGAAKAGKAVRIGGSAVGDEAVVRGARRANPKAEVQAFALSEGGVERKDVDYTRVHDPLVLRQLMNTNVDAIVCTPESALQIAMLFTTATDIQTGKMKPKPIVVLDPDGQFEQLKAELARTLHSKERQYIKLDDLDLFTTVKSDPSVALRALNLA